MRNKRNLYILILICWGIALAGAIFFFTKEPTVETYVLNYIESSDESNFIYIPVTFKDSIYQPFVFNTCSSHNFIDSAFAQKIGFNIKINDFFAKFRHTPKSQDSIASDFFWMSIENLKTAGVFILNGYKGKYYADSVYMQNVGGAVMGMEFIKDYNWLFNFADTTVTISNGQITIPALPDDQILSLNYYTHGGLTCVDLHFGDDTIRNVEFNTGLMKTVNFGSKKKYCDIIFSTSDLETLDSTPRNIHKLEFYSNGNRTILIESLQINKIEMQGLLAYENPEYVQTTITSCFIRRFRMMYFDSTNKQIQLYVSPADSTRHHRRDLQNFQQAWRKHLEESGTSTLPTSILDLLL